MRPQPLPTILCDATPMGRRLRIMLEDDLPLSCRLDAGAAILGHLGDNLQHRLTPDESMVVHGLRAFLGAAAEETREMQRKPSRRERSRRGGMQHISHAIGRVLGRQPVE